MKEVGVRLDREVVEEIRERVVEGWVEEVRERVVAGWGVEVRERLVVGWVKEEWEVAMERERDLVEDGGGGVGEAEAGGLVKEVHVIPGM